MSKYANILSYFERHQFGTEGPVLTLLSTLPPIDRCNILEIIKENEPENIEVYNKLSMAYLKNNQEDKARLLLKNALKAKIINKQTFDELDEKLTLLDSARPHVQQPSQSYRQTVDILQKQFSEDANGKYSEFYNLLIDLCHEP